VNGLFSRSLLEVMTHCRRGAKARSKLKEAKSYLLCQVLYRCLVSQDMGKQASSRDQSGTIKRATGTQQLFW